MISHIKFTTEREKIMKFFEKNPFIMIVIGVIGISSSAIIVKYSEAPSLITAAYRLLWTVALMTPAVFLNRERRKELLAASRKTIFLCAVSGILLALHFYTWFESLNYTSVASSTVIVCTESIWVALGFFLLMKGKISKKAVLCIAVTFGGSVLVAMSDYGAGGDSLYGDALALFAAVMVAGYTLLGGIVRVNTSTTVYTYIVYCFCTLSLVAASCFASLPLGGYGTQSILVGLLLSVFSTILGHSIFSWCLKYLSPTFVSTSKLCEPAIASLFAAILFGEIPSLLQCVGGIVIVCGVICYSRIERAE